MRPLLLSLILISLTFEAAQAADRFSRASGNPVSNTDASRVLDQSPSPATKADTALVEEDAPLIHPLPQSLERFSYANKLTKEGWTSTLGLLPQPETKLSLPSPDVRLQERGLHFGASFHF